MKVISLILIIVPALYFGYTGNPKEMGLAIVAGSIASAFLNLDKFKRFKGAGFEAEMKEVVTEAYATLDSLKNVAKALCGFTLSELIYGDRIGGSGIEIKTNHKDEIVSLAKELGILDATHEKLIEKFISYHTWDLFSVINSALYRYDNAAGLREELDKKVDRQTNDFPTRIELEEIFRENEIEVEVEGELKEAIQNYLYYLEHRKPKVNN